MTTVGSSGEVGDEIFVRSGGARTAWARRGDLPSTRRANRPARHVVVSAVATVGRFRGRWMVLATAACWSAYVAVAVWLIESRDFMINDAVSRSVSAKLMVLSRDPHLAAVGFYWQPIPTVTRIPFVYLLDPFGRALLAGPVTSALFAAATVPVLVAIGRELQCRAWTIVVVAIAYAANPVTVFMAANGMSESTFGFFLALAVLLFTRWRRSSDSRDLVLFGLALASCAACRHEALVILPPLLVGIAMSVPPERRRSAVVLAAVPSIAWLVGWAAVSRLITGDAVYWYTASRATTATPPGAQWVSDTSSVADAVWHVTVLLLAYSPALVPAMLVAVLRPRRAATWVAVFGVAVVLPAGLTWQLADRSTWMVPRFLAHTPLVGAMIALLVMWAATERDDEVMLATRRRTITDRLGRGLAVVALACVPLGAMTATLYLADGDRAHAEGEYLLMAQVLGRANPRGEPNHDGSNEVFEVDLAAHRALAADLDARVEEASRAPTADLEPMVVMDSLQATTVLLSRHGDRLIVPEDRDFEEILSDPVGRFEFIVVLDGRGSTEFSALISTELQRSAADGGTWAEVATHPGAGAIYRFTPSGA